MNNKYLIDKAKENRLKLFKKFYALQEGHPGSAFSILDFLVMIYYNKYIRLRKKNRKKIVIDEVIMSKGHATVAQYPILHDLGVIPQKDWENWGKNKKSLLKMFGNNLIPGIKVASGSLGNGIGLGTGIAYASKKNKKHKKVYVIISEGELYEGSTWEGLFLLSHLNLDNFYLILDVNRNIILGNPKDCLPLGNIKKKLESFGIKTLVANGHDFKSMNSSLNRMTKISKPTALILNTTKGKGLKLMENKANWHYWNKINKNEYEKSIKELKVKND